MSLPFLIPDLPSSDDDDVAAWDVWGCFTGSQVIGCAGSVGFCLLPTNCLNKISLVIRFELKGSE